MEERNLIKVRKLNIVKEVDEKRLKEFEAVGFTRIGENGDIIPAEVIELPDVAGLEARITELEAAVAEKDTKIAELEKSAPKK